MVKFIKYVLLFAIPNILILAIFEGYIKVCPNEYSYKREWMDKHASAVKTLILGSSYADWEFNPELIGDSCFNLAIPTRTVKYDCFLLEKYIDQMPDLRQIIWGYGYQVPYWDYYYPHFYRDMSSYDWILYHYQYDMGIHKETPLLPMACLYVPSFQDLIIRMISGKSDMCRFNGFNPRKLSSKGANSLNVRTTTWNVQGTKEELEAVYGANLCYLKRMLALCKSRDITFNVVITPVHKNFYVQTTQEQRTTMYQFLYDAKREYPDMNILNFFSDPGFSDNDFQDLNHLSEIGADKISKILRDTID